LVRHALGDPGQQALTMNVVKKFGQVKINHRLITSLKVSLCFGNGDVGTAVGAEPGLLVWKVGSKIGSSIWKGAC
jgi:hypothetical protein